MKKFQPRKMNKYDIETYELDPSNQGSIKVVETNKPAWKKQWWAGIDDLIEADDRKQEEMRKQKEKEQGSP